MSKCISEIIKDIHTNPKAWRRNGKYGIQNGDIRIEFCGNGFRFCWFLSIVDVYINSKSLWESMSLLDKFRIEEAHLWWMRNATVEMLRA